MLPFDLRRITPARGSCIGTLFVGPVAQLKLKRRCSHIDIHLNACVSLSARSLLAKCYICSGLAIVFAEDIPGTLLNPIPGV